ncbi:unnamed protein product [Phyllotreta striolata]|uniref:Uncharacterized protein n=1 Tax=Phyllotreta striolata TaxID=444603 RepID=A0A9N9XS82_PHYSR|nr:unnamed protein product [Phyllotreta striolata]
MDALQQENAEPNQEKNDKSTNQNDSGCETSTTKSIEETLNSTNIDNLVIAKDASAKKHINKTVYALLHRPLSPSRKNQIDSLKSKYEKSDNEKETNENSEETTNGKELIRNKSKLPLPVTRSSIKNEITPNKLSDKLKQRHSLMLDKKTKKTDENSNDVFRRKSSSSSGEFITIIPRSESVETVDQFGKELDLFTMDKKVKEKKRTSSFRKIFSGKIFNKEKKKKDETEKIIVQSDNMQNEHSFSKQSTHRSSHIPKPYPQERRVPPPNIDMHEIEKRYAEMRVKEFHSIKQNFDKQNNHVDETDEILTVTPGPMDFDKVTNIKKFIDTSSSASVESEKDSTIKTFVDQEIPYRSTRFMENHRDTPPRLQELRQSQDVRLVNPKALIPINSERPLPNPYQKPAISPKPQLAPHQNSPKPKIRQQFDYNSQKNPVLNETYGTVVDNIDRRISQKPPRSPSLEPTKLRLPPNRDTGPLSPRMRSPIPQHHVSTEKLIATELLRTSRSPTPTKKKSNHPSSSHQKLDTNGDYSDSQRVATKPPISRMVEQKGNNQMSPNYENQAAISRMANQIKPNYDNRISTRYERDSVSNYRNSMSPSYQSSPNFEPRGHHSSPYGSSQEVLMANQVPMRSPTPIHLLQNAELALIKSNSRCSTPVDQRIPQTNQTPSPQKEEMRKSVEAYYWKEIKKLKEQENRDLYYYQMQVLPFGYAEDPVNYRRSRSSSPSSLRNSRRSLSLPREPKQFLSMDRYQHLSIPEGSTVNNYQNHNVQYQQNFRRNVPERRTIDSIPRSNGNTIYRPIFKRGSLTTPVREFAEDQQQKRVSFNNNNNNQNRQAWPTRNGYTQSPPQRRMETARQESLEDDVFLPNQQQTSKLIVDGKEVYGYANRPYDNHVQQQDPYYQNANFYKQIHQEPVYNQQLEESRIPRSITRYNSMQIVDPSYGQHQKVSTRRMSVDNPQNYAVKTNPNAPRRQIYLKDDIYGYFGGYIPNDKQNVQYSSRQNVAEPNYGYTRNPQKQVSVRDKVCDIYGQIHDRESPSLSVRKSGVVLGQLQQAYPQPSGQNFVRNSRLTASANDMYRRYQNVEHNPRYPANVMYDGYQERPSPRPLPPVPTDKNVYYRQRVNNPQEFCDVQTVQSSNKGRGVVGQQKPYFQQYQPRINNSTERAILLEQLQLLKRQQALEINKWKNQQSQNRKSQQFNSNSSNYTNNGLSLEDLKKQVLLEELKLLRLKIKMEIDLK